MRILMLSYNQVGHGTFLRTYELARELVKLKHKVTIVSASKKKKSSIKSSQSHGVTIIEFPSIITRITGSGWDLLSVIARLKWLKAEDYDLVHGFESRPTVIFPAMALKRKGLPLVLDWCDWFGKGGSVEERPNWLFKVLFRPFETFFENNFRPKADANTVVCSTLYNRSLDLNVDQEKIKIIRNGFNIHGWEQITKHEGRDYFGYNYDDFIIGYVGALFQKDAALMAEAFEKVQKEFLNIKLLHLGRSNYELNSINPSVNVTGIVDELTLRKGIAACDVCWLPMSDIPANWGRFPLKFSAYLAAGKPIIATEVGDIPEIIKKFQIGSTCSPNPNSLAEKTLLLASQPKKIQFHSTAAKNLTQNPEQSWKERAKKLLTIYEMIT